MTSNKFFRAAGIVHYAELFSISRPRSVYSSAFRYFSTKKSSPASITSSDLLRVRQDLCSTLNKLESSRKRSLTANALASRKELEEIEEEQDPSQFFAQSPSASSGIDRQTAKLLALRERFRSRLQTYLQACVLVALQPNSHKKMQQLYMEAAHGSILHYNCMLNGKRSPSVSLDDPELFNTVLFGWVHAADIRRYVDVRDRCLTLRKLMKRHNVKENEGTLAAFYLLSKLPSKEKHAKEVSAISRVVDELRSTVECTPKFLADPRLTEEDRDILTSLLNTVDVKHEFLGLASASTTRYRRALLKSLNEPYGGELPTSSMESTSDGPYSSIFEDKEELLSDFAVQLEREKQGVVIVPSAFMTADTKMTIYDEMSHSIQKMWKRQLLAEFQKRKCNQTSRIQHRAQYSGIHTMQINVAPFLCLLEPEQYVDVMFEEAFRLSERTDFNGLSLKILCNSLGRKVMEKIKIELANRYGILSKIADTYERYGDYFLDWPKYAHLNHREFWLKCAVELHPLNPLLSSNSLTCDNRWLLHELGEYLYDIIIDSLTIPASLGEAVKTFKRWKKFEIGGHDGTKLVQAFFKARSAYGLKSYEELRGHQTLMDLKKKTIRREIRFDPSEMPSICPPIPWHRRDNGQSLIRSIEMIRLEPGGAESLQRANVNVAKGDVSPIMDSLNVLGSTPWTLNRPVLDVMLEIFRGEGDMKLDIPPSESTFPPLPQISAKDRLSHEERTTLLKTRQEMKKKRAELYSLWCTAHYRFSLAEFYRDKTLWFPHNVDFRGRTYPVPPFLNHMGDDICRGMMQFANGRPLGKDGLKWLKIHCINLTGFKKRDSVEARAKYADEILDDILDSAQNPLGGRRWWTTSEEPWQTLAVCMEIEKAVRMENPEEYVCHVPVHQDGSCNGLQHYAALGRDQQGAEQVNLEPASLPQDIYSAVAARIEEKRAQDAAAGLEIAQILNGFVRRKVIKQTVMTTVYGVTKYGGRSQIGRQLKDIEDFPQEYVFQASQYLVERLFESIGEIFVTARQIQDWFVASSGKISNQLRRTVEWVTPLGFPVAQPYFKPVHTCRAFASEDRLSEASVRPFPIDYLEKPDSFKQKNAFPPNYIHSLDSTHMMLTSLHCHRQGITYAAVHDSFWTHPCTIAEMGKLCRQQFIALHSQDLLEDLSRFFVRHYVKPELTKLEAIKNKKEMVKKRDEVAGIKDHFESLPQLGQFDLKSIHGSVYFFS